METTPIAKQLVELAISAGRKLQSPQTGFVHLCYFKQDEENDDTIPLEENFLFALALLRMKTVNDIQEAQGLLQKLLAFQCANGNFPTYLHEYPEAKDRFFGVRLLAPLYWIQHGFRQVLPKELREKLDSATTRLLDYCEKEIETPFPHAIRIAGALVAFGRKAEGQKRLDELLAETKDPSFGYWYSPTNIADTLVGLQMAYDNLFESPWKPLLDFMQESYFAEARTFVGPPIRLMQWEGEPECNLYDLFMGELTGNFSYNCYTSRPYHLHGVVVQQFKTPFEKLLTPFEKRGEVAGYPWQIRQEKDSSFSAIGIPAPLPPELKKGFHYFRLVWGEINNIHSFVSQGGAASAFTAEVKEDGYDLRYYLAEDTPFGDKERASEICFYIDRHEGLEITARGAKATLFHMDEELRIVSPAHSFTMKFILEAGDGRMQGHIQPGNRPAQCALKGKNRFTTYDWQIALRTVKRLTPCQVRVEIRFVK